MKGPILCILFLGYAFGLFGQSCELTITGTVVDDHTNEKVADAKIFLKSSSVKTVSDSLGRFILTGMCSGKIELVCLHHIGCEPTHMSFDLKKDTSLVVFTEMHFIELDEFELIRYNLDQGVLSTVKLSELEKFNSSGKTLGQQLEGIPGVSTLSTGNSISKPVIHGLHSNRVILLNNGIRQEGQQWGSEHAPEVDPFLSSEIAVIKGASALRYGPEAIGGVVQISPQKWSDRLGWKGSVFVGASSNGRKGTSAVLLENNSKKIQGLSFRGHVSAQKAGNISAPNYVMGNTGVEEMNYSLASRYVKGKQEFEVFYSRFNTELGIFSGAHIGNLTDLQQAIASSEPSVKSDFTYDIASPKQSILHDLVKASWGSNWREGFSTEVTYGFQNNSRKEFDTNPGYSSKSDSTVPSFQLDLFTHSLDVTIDQKLNQTMRLEYGVQALRQGNERAGRYLVPNFYKNQMGAYGIFHYKRGKWSGEGGFRYDIVQLNTYLYENKILITPRHLFQNMSSSLGASRTFGHHLVVKGSVGNAWRPPSISELYSDGLHHGAAAIERGNRNIGAEKSVQGNVTGIYKSKRLNVQADLYHIHFLNFIYLNPQNELELTIKGAFPSFAYEEVEARFSGLDLTVDYALFEKLKVRSKYSFVRAYNITQQSFLVGIPSDNWSNSLTYSRTTKSDHVLTAEIEGKYVFRQTRFEVDADYSDPPSDYLLFSASLNYEIPVRLNRIQIGLVAENILDKSYRNYMNRFRYYTDEIGRNISLKIKYQFKKEQHEIIN